MERTPFLTTEQCCISRFYLVSKQRSGKNHDSRIDGVLIAWYVKMGAHSYEDTRTAAVGEERGKYMSPKMMGGSSRELASDEITL